MTENAAQPTLFATEDNMITVYGQPECGPCHAVIRRLEKAEVPHQYVDLTEHPSQQQRLVEAGYQRTPIIETPHERFAGNDPDRINKAIEQARAHDIQQKQALELRTQQETELS